MSLSFGVRFPACRVRKAFRKGAAAGVGIRGGPVWVSCRSIHVAWS